MHVKVDIKHEPYNHPTGPKTGCFEVQISTPTFDEDWPFLSTEYYYYGEPQYYPDAETALKAATEFYNGAVRMHAALSRRCCEYDRGQLSTLLLEARKIDSQK